MEKLNELEKWCQDVVESWPATTKLSSFNHRLIRDVFYAFRALEQRAEAAEAKLAELKRQKPYGWLIGLPGLYPSFTLDYRNVEQAIAAGGYEITPIYTQPAPAINLAQPVPDGWTHNSDADAALVMLDRIDTLDAADDGRVEDVKRIIRKMAAALAAPQNAAQNIPEIIPGWKLVPVIAFPSQWAAGQKAFDSAGINKVDAVYKAMVAAAPEVP